MIECIVAVGKGGGIDGNVRVKHVRPIVVKVKKRSRECDCRVRHAVALFRVPTSW